MTAEAETRPGLVSDIRQVLEPPELRRLFLARSISVTGDMMVPVALAFAVLQLTGSAAALGIVLAARAAPALIFMLHGGAIGDRYPRRVVMVTAQLVAAAAQVGLGVVILAESQNLVLLCVLVAVRGATSAFFNPSSTAAVASVAEGSRRQKAFSLFALVGSSCEVAGPVMAGLMMAIIKPGWVILLDGLTFIISALLIARCTELGNGNVSRKQSMVRQIADGVALVRNTSWLAALILSASVFQLTVLSSLNVLGPLVAEQSLGGSSAWAAVAAAMGLGGVVGSILGLRIRVQYPLRIAYLMGLLAAGPTLVLLASPAPLWAIIVSEFVAGAAITLFGTIESTVISNHVPGELLSRIDSLNRLGSSALKPLGMALVAPFAFVVGLQQALYCAAAIGAIAMVAPLLMRVVRLLPAEPR